MTTPPPTAAGPPAARPAGRDGGTLRLSGLTAARGGRTVLHDVSLDIPAGQVTALLGPNGAGKSTLVLAVGGVLGPQSGSVLLGGQELARRRPERISRAGLAIVPEGRRLLAELTVAENLRVATYALPAEQARAGSSGRWSCSRRSAAGCPPRPGRCPGASSRWSCWPRPWSPSRATC